MRNERSTAGPTIPTFIKKLIDIDTMGTGSTVYIIDTTCAAAIFGGGGGRGSCAIDWGIPVPFANASC